MAVSLCHDFSPWGFWKYGGMEGGYLTISGTIKTISMGKAKMIWVPSLSHWYHSLSMISDFTQNLARTCQRLEIRMI